MSWDFLVGTVWLHLFLCLYEYISTGKKNYHTCFYSLVMQLFVPLTLIQNSNLFSIERFHMFNTVWFNMCPIFMLCISKSFDSAAMARQ